MRGTSNDESDNEANDNALNTELTANFCTGNRGTCDIPIRIHHRHRVIPAIRKQVMGTNRADFTQQSIGIDEPAPHGIVIPAAQIIQAGFLVVYISTIAEGIQNTKGIREGSGHGNGFSPRIVLIFYYKVSSIVNNCHNIALEVVDVTVFDAIVFYEGRPGLRIIEEVEFVFASFNTFFIYHSLGQMGNQFTMERIVVGGSNTIFYNLLLSSQAVMVVLKGNYLACSSGAEACRSGDGFTVGRFNFHIAILK